MKYRGVILTINQNFLRFWWFLAVFSEVWIGPVISIVFIVSIVSIVIFNLQFIFADFCRDSAEFKQA